MADKMTTDAENHYQTKKCDFLDHYLKLYGFCTFEMAKKLLGDVPRMGGYIEKNNCFYDDLQLCDQSEAVAFISLLAPQYQYTINEFIQGRGYRKEEAASRAAVREWMAQHHIKKPDTVLRRLRVLQEELLRAFLLSEAGKAALAIKNKYLETLIDYKSILQKAALVTDPYKTACLVGFDYASLLPLLQAWNGCIRLPILNASTINEYLDDIETKKKRVDDFLSPADPKIGLLNHHLVAMQHLYTIIPVEKAYEIIESQNPGLISRIEFQDYCRFGFVDPFGETVFRDNEICAQSVLQDKEKYNNLKAQQKGKPWYVPPKDELLKYFDPDYVQDTPERRALESFLLKKLHVDQKKAENCIIMLTVAPTDIKWVLNQMVSMEIYCNTEAQLNEFLNLQMNFANNLRVPENRGYTPNEMARLMGKNRGPMQIQFGPGIMDRIEKGTMSCPEWVREIERRGAVVAPETKLKIGRNEPCPCGSGKKYKKCCGKMN